MGDESSLRELYKIGIANCHSDKKWAGPIDLSTKDMRNGARLAVLEMTFYWQKPPAWQIGAPPLICIPIDMLMQFNSDVYCVGPQWVKAGWEFSIWKL